MSTSFQSLKVEPLSNEVGAGRLFLFEIPGYFWGRSFWQKPPLNSRIIFSQRAGSLFQLVVLLFTWRWFLSDARKVTLLPRVPC